MISLSIQSIFKQNDVKYITAVIMWWPRDLPIRRSKELALAFFVNSVCGVNYLWQIWHDWLPPSFICWLGVWNENVRDFEKVLLMGLILENFVK